MLPFIAFSIQAAYAAAFGPAELRNPMYVVPDSSVPKWYDSGKAVHTHLIQWNGGYLHPGYDVIAQNDSSEITAGPWARITTPSGYSPATVAAAYGIPSLAGSKAIAIVDAYHYATSLNDFNVFSQQFGLPTETSTSLTASTNQHFQVVYEGTTAPSTNTSWNMEEALDIEWAHAMAPEAKIYLVEANSSSFSDLFTAVEKAAALTNVKEVSMSWGAAEFSSEFFYDSTFAQNGVVYFASTGDTKAIQEYPSESPNVVAVGGTTLTIAKGVVSSEVPWTSTGGGISKYESIPKYQSAVSAFVGKMRGAADVSAVANPSTGVAVYDTSGEKGWLVVGGTSLSSPLVAGMTNAAGSFLASSSAELTKIYGGLGSTNFRTITGLPSVKDVWYYATGIGSPLGPKGL
jgi:kumamolisin